MRYQAAYYLKRLVRSFVTDHAIAAPLCEPLLKGIQVCVCVCACQLLAPSSDVNVTGDGNPLQKYLLIPFPGSAEDAAALPPPQQAHMYVDMRAPHLLQQPLTMSSRYTATPLLDCLWEQSGYLRRSATNTWR